MARKRYVSPKLFENEHLGDAPQDWYVLLFVGLWTLADREGYLEEKPKMFKMRLFPYKDRAVDEGLAWLASTGLITRYEVNNNKYIYIPNFEKHQKPHPHEPVNDVPRIIVTKNDKTLQNTAESDNGTASRAFPSFPSLTSFPTSPSLPTITATTARQHPFLLVLQEKAGNPRIKWAATKNGFDDNEAQTDAIAQVSTLEQQNGTAAVLDAFTAEHKQSGSLSILEMRKRAADRLVKKQTEKPVVTPTKKEAPADYSMLKPMEPKNGI